MQDATDVHRNLFVLDKSNEINMDIVVTVIVQFPGIVCLMNSRIDWHDTVCVLSDDRQNSTIWIETKTGTALL